MLRERTVCAVRPRSEIREEGALPGQQAQHARRGKGHPRGGAARRVLPGQPGRHSVSSAQQAPNRPPGSTPPHLALGLRVLQQHALVLLVPALQVRHLRAQPAGRGHTGRGWLSCVRPARRLRGASSRLTGTMPTAQAPLRPQRPTHPRLVPRNAQREEQPTPHPAAPPTRFSWSFCRWPSASSAAVTLASWSALPCGKKEGGARATRETKRRLQAV